MISDVLLNSTFPADELNLLKRQIKVELQQQQTSPFFLATQRLRTALFGRHPAAVISTTAESLGAVTPEVLTKWHQEHYSPQKSILGIAGDVYAAQVIPKLRKWLGRWRRTAAEVVLPPNPAPASTRRIYLVDRPNSVQTTFMTGNITVDRRDPDYIPMVLMNRVLGDGASARLFMKLREEKGYTYAVYSNFVAGKYPGLWFAFGDVRTGVTEGALAEFINEIRHMCEEKVPEAELDERKRSVVASFALSLEEPNQLLNYAITRKMYRFSADYWDTYPARIMGVSGDDVQRVALKYINPEAIQIVAVGDASKIKSILEKYGALDIYDTKGALSTDKSAYVRASKR